MSKRTHARVDTQVVGAHMVDAQQQRKKRRITVTMVFETTATVAQVRAYYQRHRMWGITAEDGTAHDLWIISAYGDIVRPARRGTLGGRVKVKATTNGRR